jgi:hypothetical protein
MQIVKVASALAVVALAGIGLVSVADADHHHGGAAKVQGKGPGKHIVLSTKHGHQAHAHVNNNHRVNGISVTQNGKFANVKTKKVKTRVRRHAMVPGEGGDTFLAQGNDEAGQHMFMAADPAQVQVWVGWAFYYPQANMWVFIWFPMNMVEGGDSGCQDIDNGDNGGGDII